MVSSTEAWLVGTSSFGTAVQLLQRRVQIGLIEIEKITGRAALARDSAKVLAQHRESTLPGVGLTNRFGTDKNW